MARPVRQVVARAFKLWTRAGGLPRVPGWVVEAVVVFRDSTAAELDALELFDRIIDWFADSASPAAMCSAFPAATRSRNALTGLFHSDFFGSLLTVKPDFESAKRYELTSPR